MADDFGRAPTGQALVQAPSPTVSALAGFDPSRMAMFLEILSSMGGESDASDYPSNWINAFCEEHEGRDPDTFNQAIDAGYVNWSHDSDSDYSTITLTGKGRFALAAGAQRAETTQLAQSEGRQSGAAEQRNAQGSSQ